MKKKQKRFRWIGMAALLLCLLALPVQANAAKASIKLSASKKSLTVGKTVKLKATVTGKSKKVTWKSSKSSVASVNSKGVVTAKKVGKAKITAKANGKTAKCVITVTKSKNLYVYLGANIHTVAKNLGSMKKSVSGSSIYYKETSGNSVKTALTSDKNSKITSVSIGKNSKYNIKGIKAGMSRSKAMQILKKAGWECTYAHGSAYMGTSVVYYSKGKYTIALWTGRSETLTSVVASIVS